MVCWFFGEVFAPTQGAIPASLGGHSFFEIDRLNEKHMDGQVCSIYMIIQRERARDGYASLMCYQRVCARSYVFMHFVVRMYVLVYEHFDLESHLL